MSSLIYNQVYVCLQVDVNNVCTTWQAQISGEHFTPELAGVIILCSITLNLIVAGFKSMRRVM